MDDLHAKPSGVVSQRCRSISVLRSLMFSTARKRSQCWPAVTRTRSLPVSVRETINRMLGPGGSCMAVSKRMMPALGLSDNSKSYVP